VKKIKIAVRIIFWIVFLTVSGYYLIKSQERAKAFSGPGIRGNLFQLEEAKAQWYAGHKNGTEWPTRNDLLPYLTSSPKIHSIDEVINPRGTEIYIINKIGSPVLAYYPQNHERIYGGQLICLNSNDLKLIVP
jgi:hypothetical protein